MRFLVFSGFEKQLKEIGKKYKFDTESFFSSLYREISDNPKGNAVVIAETASYLILKRRVSNPKIKKGKSYGFRVWYCLKEQEICFCLIEDVSDKDKEKNTQRHIAQIREFMKQFDV